MKAKLAVGLAFLFLGNVAPARGQQERPQNPLSISLLGLPWALAIDAPGFTVKVNETKPDGRRYLVAENGNTKVIFSVFLERVDPALKSKDCREKLQQQVTASSPFKMKDIRLGQIGEMQTLEYMVPEHAGLTVRQKNLFACMKRDDVYVDMHLSKVSFKPGEGQLFTSILNTVRFTDQNTAAPPSSAPSSKDYLREGSRLYLQRRYREAIGPYQKALDLEKKDPRLDKNLWRVLVDNLGISYGVTGDLKSAQEVFEYGLSKDATYPLFYYNMACVYAEKNDLASTMSYLQKAFVYKANVIPGEQMPDPRSDDSFQRFLNNKKFLKFLDSLGKQ